ncbi:hypothetical protein LEP1GSC172_0233 [Leptospira noguchii]|uniref:Uncharacterized protein n=2 Tax=Leptospira noguchii TaxID=28182 RepID=T0GSN5_9LEPT|nr:hypothetical protein LEP1GSC172_0233 [Leptospira noguchii]EQA71937.1 hypothetical protein LEP1GSC059_0892 [Leptospira noguchii serovar Panama str. CZ214]
MGGIHFSEFVFLPFSDSIYFYGKKLFCFANRLEFNSFRLIQNILNKSNTFEFNFKTRIDETLKYYQENRMYRNK